MSTDPFYHLVIDNFFDEKIAQAISEEFFDFDDPRWFYYNNPLEKKKTMNHWLHFPGESYRQFTFLCSDTFVRHLSNITGVSNLYPDVGLHGGGWHLHGQGQKLNVHKDYSIHPKLKLQRRLNLIVYLTPDWNPGWGGGLELWSHDKETDQPKECRQRIDCIFNRAVIFDTTQNSWHGLPNPISCPENVYRKSLAVYYLTEPPTDCDPRQRALYAPTEDQKNSQEISALIQERSR